MDALERFGVDQMSAKSEITKAMASLLREIQRMGQISTAIMGPADKATAARLVRAGLLERGRSGEGDARYRVFYLSQAGAKSLIADGEALRADA